MKKTLTILSATIITFLSFHAKAQDADANEPLKSYMTFLSGISIPIGSYGASNYSTSNAGFAKKGITYGLDGVFYIHKNFGFGVTLTYQDQGELNTNDVQNLANGFTSDLKKTTTEVTSVDRNTNLVLMGGPQYSFVYHVFTLDLRASAGAIKSISTPYLTILFDDATSTATTYYQLSSSALAFAYGGSAALRWAFSDNWDLGIKENFINSSGIKIENSGNPDTGGRYITKQPITMLQTTLGITLRF